MPNSTDLPEGWVLKGKHYEKTLDLGDGREARLAYAAALVTDANFDLLVAAEVEFREKAVNTPRATA